MNTEKPFFDKFGREIKEFDLLKFYHFTGRNAQGRGRKHYYMYKWVKLKKCGDIIRFICLHLDKDFDNVNGYFLLTASACKHSNIIADAEIIQGSEFDKRVVNKKALDVYKYHKQQDKKELFFIDD